MRSSPPDQMKWITDSIELPFEPTMEDIIAANGTLQVRNHAQLNEVSLEIRSGRWDSDEVRVFLVFSRHVPNENFDRELREYKNYLFEVDQHLRQEQARRAQEKSNIEARNAWKLLHRQERVSRRVLGRHTLK